MKDVKHRVTFPSLSVKGNCVHRSDVYWATKLVTDDSMVRQHRIDVSSDPRSVRSVFYLITEIVLSGCLSGKLTLHTQLPTNSLTD